MAFDSDTYHGKIQFAKNHPEHADAIMQATGRKREDPPFTVFVIDQVARERVGFGNGSNYRDLTNSMQRAYKWVFKHKSNGVSV